MESHRQSVGIKVVGCKAVAGINREAVAITRTEIEGAMHEADARESVRSWPRSRGPEVGCKMERGREI